jgi:hypothetical protein
MSHKPTLTRALDAAIDVTRQALRDPAVKEAAADLLTHVGRKLADKAEHGAMALRARAEASTAPPQPHRFGSTARRGVTALAEAMVRSTAHRERSGRVAPKGIAATILDEAAATYRRVHAEYDGVLAEARAAEEAEEAGPKVDTELPDEPVLLDDTPPPVAEADADAVRRTELPPHGIPTGMAAAAIGSPGPGDTEAPAGDRAELPGDSGWDWKKNG